MREKVWKFIGRHAGGAQWRILWVSQPKFIVGVSGLVRDDAGHVLLIKGRMWKPSRPWGLVTGYAESGEQWHETVTREAREETGYEVKALPEPVRLVTGFRLRAEVAFLAEFIGGTYTPDPKEVLDAQFFDIDALPDGLLPSHRELIEQNRNWFKGDDIDRAHAQREADRHAGTEAGDP
ncbi:NUDIX domain-containing protein [Catenulispora sp. NF23]|uniref:NUDIX domain-containing protein n=1 Tax=Catenulispora pinistramenti TaxID=2705254 RepID=A0ABS5KJ10_9ACTN|nr:NUDIX domain-containing protein [Catenulispora pinistramenti]MBS2532215.1 NUDIX domain-containing protein [Catenulispora pinistramenti]MBS2546384.1 NUDIX domain-containing protein [Catenulispora pinistramenti]